MPNYPITRAVLMQDAAAATGNGTHIDVRDMAALGMQVSGTFVATVTFEGTVDDSNWVSVEVVNSASGAKSTTATAAGVFLCGVAGLSRVRARVTWTSGTSITVKGLASTASLAPLQDAGANDGVDIGNVDVASIAAGDNNIGNVDVASIAAGDNNIGNVDIVTLPAAIQGPGSPTIDSYTSAAVDLAASTTNQVLVAAPGANKQIWVYGLFMTADTAAGTVVLQDEDDTPLTGTMAISDEGGWVWPLSGNFAMPWTKVATNKALEADTGACTVDGIVCYAIVSV